MRLFPWTLGLILAAQAGAALADELPLRLPDAHQKPPDIMTLRSMHLRNLAVREESVDPTPAREHWSNRLEPSNGGFKYHDSFVVDGRRYRFSVRGPVQKERRLGLTFELRF